MNSPVRTRSAQGAIARKTGGGLVEAAHIWMQVSVAGVGGPALQIATMHRLLVQGRRWISEERFFHALGYCIAMPGPETQQLATYIGWLSHRMLGGMLAGGLFLLPGAICMMALCFGFVTGADSEIGQAIFIGVKPAILAILIEAILRFGRTVLPTSGLRAIAALAFAAAFCKV
ncbi:MAG: chromate transporter, partial [Pseudomonadota bacterium]